VLFDGYGVSLINLVITLISPFFFCKWTTKNEAMFFSNEEHNLMVVLPDGKFIKLYLGLYENRGNKIFHLNTSEF